MSHSRCRRDRDRKRRRRTREIAWRRRSYANWRWLFRPANLFRLMSNEEIIEHMRLAILRVEGVSDVWISGFDEHAGVPAISYEITIAGGDQLAFAVEVDQ